MKRGRKRASAWLLAVLMTALAACGTKAGQGETAGKGTDAKAGGSETGGASGGERTDGEDVGGEKILNAGVSFNIASMDAHLDYNGWYTNVYGVTEELFKLNGNYEVEPWLAEKAESEGKTWTITLKKEAAFSNGKALTADMVVRNLMRAAEKNERFAWLGEYEMKAVDERTLTITTPEVYPTMMNDLASPELAIMDLDDSEDIDNNPVCTGPFVVSEFEPKGTVKVSRNENYWNGNAKLDGAVFYYMPEDDTKQMALQSGEIDCYDFVTASAMEIYAADPDNYNLTVLPASRLQFYILNEERLEAGVRQAVTLTVDKEAIASFLQGTVTAAKGPFAESSAYGKVTVPAVDLEKAKASLEGAGYVRNGNGFYEKDGKELDLNIAYYASRSLDSLAILIQEQLKEVGINSHLTCEEDPDATYIATGDFDLALYCMIADKAGDPYYFIDSTLRDGAYFDVGGFDDPECEKLIDQLKYEIKPQKRAELANQIVQRAIDDHAFGYVGLFNKVTVTLPGVTGFAEDLPYDFYGIDADSDKQ